MTFNPEVYIIKPIEAIVWRGSFFKIIYPGDHTFLLEPILDGKIWHVYFSSDKAITVSPSGTSDSLRLSIIPNQS